MIRSSPPDSLTGFWQILTVTPYQEKLPFYVSECGYYEASDRYFLERDGRGDCLLMITTGGRGQLFWNGQSAALGPGSAVVIDCRSYQKYRTEPGGTWSFWWLHFGGIAAESYRGMLFDQLKPVMLRDPEAARLRMEELYAQTKSTSVTSFALQSNHISAVLTELLLSMTDDPAHAPLLEREDIARLAVFIRDNCVEDLHIDDFVRETHLSRHHLIRLFEKQIGMSPYRYLHMCRIHHAQLMLRSTEIPVSEIAYGVGYNSPTVLIRHFRSFQDMTPGEYRTKYRNQTP